MSSPFDSEEKPKRTRRRVVRDDDGDEIVEVKKPRKTTVRKTVSKKAATPVRRVSKRTAALEAEMEDYSDIDTEENPNRKAPTPIASKEANRKQKNKQLMIVGALLVIGVGASAAVGFTDKGQINVNQTIEARNERLRTNTRDERDFATSQIEVPVQNTNNSDKPDGGLIGLGTGGAAPKTVSDMDKSTTTATSSAITASSTEAVATSTEAAAEAVIEENTEIETEPNTAEESSDEPAI